ncbi:dolichol-phosphate mannosyltransferase subunit 3 [Zootermopsis nevadensis]|uniref:dolichol-phosphate mannosyltransferase subunit 3 n=1 Tax=Zootermopsis nevadensis TaxID=136037 RepID=UPI000B8EC152|nr:dolichol-phosphate mannosyltransferase subunit 3 [Zootermopsis nevadensis]XP_021928449.1 dolichol-phosphate mannosyltransferase subunit 3 [Zootermopsis nevadensis]XP_021928450.1 dolichol-phosphate mannosyltransferase subunit 3 [Zootermopsis nevadensis]XP_021928451.1 dolichol-phosphate mannosyltransferase subunit 3 [Zootermopsis nevadensis]XP_021928453.1 dolichol-phosphate mannosyltransferase subunit 3 [Zootermopsis nevadensis]
MTKLIEWLFGMGIFLGIWGALISRQIKVHLLEEWMSVIVPLPLILVTLFGVYSVIVVLWRVYTFNNCDEAAKELQKEIQQAKADLRQKGISFIDDK